SYPRRAWSSQCTTWHALSTNHRMHELYARDERSPRLKPDLLVSRRQATRLHTVSRITCRMRRLYGPFRPIRWEHAYTTHQPWSLARLRSGVVAPRGSDRVRSGR